MGAVSSGEKVSAGDGESGTAGSVCVRSRNFRRDGAAFRQHDDFGEGIAQNRSDEIGVEAGLLGEGAKGLGAKGLLDLLPGQRHGSQSVRPGRNLGGKASRAASLQQTLSPAGLLHDPAEGLLDKLGRLGTGTVPLVDFFNEVSKTRHHSVSPVSKSVDRPEVTRFLRERPAATRLSR